MKSNGVIAQTHVSSKPYMNNKHDIDTYSKLALGTAFYLEESFIYIHKALANESAGIIFSDLLQSVEVNEKDKQIMESFELPDNPVGILQSEIPDILSDETLSLLASSWGKAQADSRTAKHKFSLKHKINSIEMLGHLNNFGFFLETLINRHLLFLNHSKLIEDFSYSRLSQAKVIERLIYIFKDELNNNKVQLNEITNLFSLRNKTVHFTPDNAMALQPKISELIQIWTQSIKIIKQFEKKEKFNEVIFSTELNNYSKEFKTRWT